METNATQDEATDTSYQVTHALRFDWLDYGVFFGMLAVSTVIGIYFGCFGTRQRTKNEYLLGNKNMNIFPIAMSLTASHISGITILGAPSEMYTYGTQYWMMCLAACIVCIIVAVAYMPVFYALQLTSTYEYLELRFSNNVRLVASLIFTLNLILYIPIVIYVPALAFSQVTGVNLHFITPIVSIICIFYTMLGGLKAVVWTDTLQQIIMMGSSIAVIILGLIDVGGVSTMWQRNLAADRIEFFNMDPNPLARNTFWTVTIGTTFIWLSHCGVNQGMMQRFLALPSLNAARWALLIFCIGIFWCKSVSCFTGLLIHAKYHNCDPITTEDIKRPDQLLPYYVMHIASHIPGLPGLFVAGVFCAALSSMSTGLNTLSGTIYEDFLSRCFGKDSEARTGYLMRLTVCIIGAMCVGLVFLIEMMGSVIHVSVTLGGITHGAMLGIFSLGMFVPRANTKGALVGGFASLVLVGWLVIGAQTAVSRGEIHFPWKPMSVEGCSNATFIPPANSIHLSGKNSNVPEVVEKPFILYRLSYLYFNVVGCLTVILVGYVVSLLTGPRDPRDMDYKLFSPVVRRFLPKPTKQYSSVKGALKNLQTSTLT